MRWRPACLLLGLLMAGGCARDVRVPFYPVYDTGLIILEPSTSTPEAQRAMRWLREMAPQATVIAHPEWLGLLEEPQNRIVVVPEARQLPASTHPLIASALERGTRMLLLGPQAFETRPPANAIALPSFSDVQLWRLELSRTSARGSVRAARAAGLPWPGIDVDIEGTGTRDTMQLVDWPETGLSALQGQQLVFYARASAGLSRLVLHAEGHDGRIWVATPTVTPEWEPVQVRPTDWLLLDAQDEQTPVPWADMASFRVGLDQAVAPHAGGRQMFSLSDLRLAPDQPGPITPDEMTPLIAHRDSRYGVNLSRIAGMGSDARFHLRRVAAEAIWPGASAWRTDAAARWFPLFQAVDEEDTPRGDIAGVYLRDQQIWGWSGLPAARRSKAAWQAIVNECLFHLQQGRFLMGAHPDRYVYESGEPIMVSAGLRAAHRAPSTVRVVAELHDPAGTVIRRATSAPVLLGGDQEPAGSVQLRMGDAPVETRRFGVYALQVRLEEVGGRALIFDRLTFPLHIAGERPTNGEWIEVSGARLVEGRIPIFLHGLAYQPGLARQTDSSWLYPHLFPADRVAQDLQALRGTGINTVVLEYTEPAQGPQLRYVIETARSAGLWVAIRWPTAIANAQRPGWVKDMMGAADLGQRPEVVLFDLAPTKAVDMATAAWLLEQYPEDTPRFPVDWDGLAHDDPVWSVWRRLHEDMTSRTMGHVAREIRSAGGRSLITATVSPPRSAFFSTGSLFDFGIGGAHLDVAAVSLDHLRDPDWQPGFTAFWAGYARGWLESRPLIWTDFGTPLGGAPSDADLIRQADQYKRYLSLARGTQAAGAWSRHLAPVSTRRLDRDEGWRGPDGRERPVVRAAREVNQALRNYRPSPLQWQGRETDLYRDRTGSWQLPDDWGRLYQSEWEQGQVQEIRPVGWSRASTAAPRDRLDGSEQGPFREVNAEWGQVEIGRHAVPRAPGAPVVLRTGQTLRLQLINTGLAAWIASRDRAAGTIWVSASQEGERTVYLSVPDTGPLGQGPVEWQPAIPGKWILRAHWLGAGDFGESLLVQVE